MLLREVEERRETDGPAFDGPHDLDAARFVASTLNISNENFLAGKMNFDKAGNANASIVNQGSITAAEGGLVALVAPGVENSGTITANAPAIHFQRRPKAKSSETPTTVKIAKLPKSGCFMHRKQRTPATSRCGRKPTLKLLIRSAFLESEYASQQTMASLASSAGWMWTGPSEIQRSALPARWPKPATGSRARSVSSRAPASPEPGSSLSPLDGERAFGGYALMSDDTPKQPDAVRITAAKCVCCEAPVTPRTRPFCSQRCADIDLGGWLTERYRVPGGQAPPEDGGGGETP